MKIEQNGGQPSENQTPLENSKESYHLNSECVWYSSPHCNLIARKLDSHFVKFQDAQEFYLHLLSVLEREDKVRNRPSCITPLQFAVEDRIQCSVTSKVRHQKASAFYLKVLNFDNLTIQCSVTSKVRHQKASAFNLKVLNFEKLTKALVLLRIEIVLGNLKGTPPKN